MADTDAHQHNLNKLLILISEVWSLAIFRQMRFVILKSAGNGFYCAIVCFI